MFIWFSFAFPVVNRGIVLPLFHDNLDVLMITTKSIFNFPHSFILLLCLIIDFQMYYWCFDPDKTKTVVFKYFWQGPHFYKRTLANLSNQCKKISLESWSQVESHHNREPFYSTPQTSNKCLENQKAIADMTKNFTWLQVPGW